MISDYKSQQYPEHFTLQRITWLGNTLTHTHSLHQSHLPIEPVQGQQCTQVSVSAGKSEDLIPCLTGIGWAPKVPLNYSWYLVLPNQ